VPLLLLLREQLWLFVVLRKLSVGVFRQALQFIMNILMDAYSDVFTDVSLRRIMFHYKARTC
jgi:hypothetical protein